MSKLTVQGLEKSDRAVVLADDAIARGPGAMHLVSFNFEHDALTDELTYIGAATREFHDHLNSVTVLTAEVHAFFASIDSAAAYCADLKTRLPRKGNVTLQLSSHTGTQRRVINGAWCRPISAHSEGSSAIIHYTFKGDLQIVGLSTVSL